VSGEAEAHIQRALKEGVRGPDPSCRYYPCHRWESQDCTWCYCPFYPCLDPGTGGRWKTSDRTGKEVWTCIDCVWIHQGEVPGRVLEALRASSGCLEEEERRRLRKRIREGGHG
jgi:Zn-finger protein